MEITSYFIGLQLEPSLFTNLFVTMQDFLKENGIEGNAIIQNILSLHITLYYLSNEYVKDHLHLILSEIDTENAILKENAFTVKKLNYFSPNETKRIYYIEPDNQTLLKAINTHFSNSLEASDIQENNYQYTPHITLFTLTLEKVKIKQFAQLETILQNELQKLNHKSIAIGILYHKPLQYISYFVIRGNYCFLLAPHHVLTHYSLSFCEASYGIIHSTLTIIEQEGYHDF